ncbi:hypothetical protein [Candidatus Amarobacter glycogenicus]|uniref:hypothetical protein n=1 Tax=Candidatus Amarobacter glycogenicus TaxID=3140699 RepID=UPI002A12FE84|nr:hypothetical protein [Dehalococcoidia bacterium]
MTGSVPLRVLLADARAIVRKGIREFLEEDGEGHGGGRASGGARPCAWLANTGRPWSCSTCRCPA